MLLMSMAVFVEVVVVAKVAVGPEDSNADLDIGTSRPLNGTTAITGPSAQFEILQIGLPQ